MLIRLDVVFPPTTSFSNKSITAEFLRSRLMGCLVYFINYCVRALGHILGIYFLNREEIFCKLPKNCGAGPDHRPHSAVPKRPKGGGVSEPLPILQAYPARNTRTHQDRWSSVGPMPVDC